MDGSRLRFKRTPKYWVEMKIIDCCRVLIITIPETRYEKQRITTTCTSRKKRNEKNCLEKKQYYFGWIIQHEEQVVNRVWSEMVPEGSSQWRSRPELFQVFGDLSLGTLEHAGILVNNLFILESSLDLSRSLLDKRVFFAFFNSRTATAGVFVNSLSLRRRPIALEQR